ncbi:tetratricopeptide repeat protein [Bradyrhizobium sp. dw_411]|uniref:tetratricopeptide repeat protein n=1 Tax=Bradyrhizobium sp. dw_411 TaxID=2720082 RepID=UPI001BCA9CDA|nr:tetratricopeptide repeat protein [Bradyrhizobium sp. dw_411]
MPSTAFATHFPDVNAEGPLAQRQLRIGVDHYNAGETGEAISAFQLGLASVGNEAPDAVAVEIVSELHAKLGNAWMIRGDLESAGENYKAALRLAPHLTDCWCNFGNVHLKTGRPQDAITLYLQALKLNAGHWPARTNLVHALMATQQYIIARALLLELIGERPQDGQLRQQLGKVCFELNEFEAAIKHFQEAVALDPRDADSINWMGGIRQRMGDAEGAHAAYAAAAEIQPLIKRPAAKSPAEFRVLALYAPFGGNTPTEYIFKDAVHDTDTLALFASRDYDAQLFRQNVQVVVNLISDADQADTLLPMAAGLADRLDLPTVNHPRRIQRTTRDEVAVLLQGIPGCNIPKALRHPAGADTSVAALQAAIPFSSSVLARPVGTHGGDDFEKIEDPAALSAFLKQRPDHDHYLIEYIDYRSDDGHFRKYRFIFVDGQVLPYHLAIGNDWKVHHVSTDMANQPWMQQEEEAFLNDPASVFAPANYVALRAIQQRIGLEYFGIDCGLDRSGKLVVFEVNASMLVHAKNEDFPYKTPAVQRIKLVFDAMLRKLAGVGAC